MPILEYSLLAFGSLFAIIDAVAAIPAFLAMTSSNTPQERSSMAKTACVVCAATLALFGLLGPGIFSVFGITMPAFQIAGGIVLLLVALDMLRAKRSSIQETEEETAAGRVKDDIAITPLAIPMLSGPGAISTVIVLSGKTKTWAHDLALYAAILLASLASYFVLALASRGAKCLGPIFMRVATRLMGLLLASIAVQFILSALKEFL